MMRFACWQVPIIQQNVAFVLGLLVMEGLLNVEKT
jgi:hypothetical protein